MSQSKNSNLTGNDLSQDRLKECAQESTSGAGKAEAGSLRLGSGEVRPSKTIAELANEFISALQAKTYSIPPLTTDFREGDLGTWDDWKAALIEFAQRIPSETDEGMLTVPREELDYLFDALLGRVMIRENEILTRMAKINRCLMKRGEYAEKTSADRHHGGTTVEEREKTDGLCPHGFVLADNTCGPCSEGRPNRLHENGEGSQEKNNAG
jgi:hypothetical protein